MSKLYSKFSTINKGQHKWVKRYSSSRNMAVGDKHSLEGDRTKFSLARIWPI